MLLVDSVSSAHNAVLRPDLLPCSLFVMPSYWTSALLFMPLAGFQMRQMPAGKPLSCFSTVARKLQAEGLSVYRFQQRVQQYTSLWCCSQAHPGHVWYDIFWDQIPHTDRHNRGIEGPWQPQFGP